MPPSASAYAVSRERTPYPSGVSPSSASLPSLGQKTFDLESYPDTSAGMATRWLATASVHQGLEKSWSWLPCPAMKAAGLPAVCLGSPATHWPNSGTSASSWAAHRIRTSARTAFTGILAGEARERSISTATKSSSFTCRHPRAWPNRSRQRRVNGAGSRTKRPAGGAQVRIAYRAVRPQRDK